MRILVTGATGLIGTQLCRHLLSKGHSLHILTRTPWQTDDAQTKVFQWSPQNMQIDHRALVGVHAIINLAGAKINQRWTAKNKRSILKSRIQSTRLLFDAVKQTNQKPHLINASAIGIYPSDFQRQYTEADAVFSNDFDGEVVRQWEEEAKQFEKLFCKTTILRIGLVLSSKGGAFVPLSLPTRWGFGAWFGNGQQWQSWIHIDDLVGVIDYCLQNKMEGCINATAPNPVCQRDLIQTIAKKVGAPQFLPGIPKFLMSIALGEMHKLVYDSIYAKPERLLDSRFPYQFPEFSACVADLIATYK
ncbi:MAG: TIGR01777 family oxidoreductase [Flavobacteriaceae bacterium]|nr:TIGR01777 family oxidoreductase [Flavobacteriaceae bacterium]